MGATMSFKRLRPLVLCGVFAAGCRDPLGADAGPSGNSDAGIVDAGSILDSGSEASIGDAAGGLDAAAQDAHAVDAALPQDGGITDAGSFTCERSLSELVSTDELILVDGAPMGCNSPEGSSMLCGIFRASVRMKPDGGPIGMPGYNADIEEFQVLLVVRAKDEEALCSNRWIVMESGGLGQGYGSSFGDVPNGHYVEGGLYGDDMVRKFNDDGYVTADIVYNCGPQSGCVGTPYAGWVTTGQTVGRASAWYLSTGGTGYLGISGRSKAIYEWAYVNSGNRRVCAHAQSSGSGRLAGVLTRYDSLHMFDTVVFNGGPVFAYVPWMCNVDGGPLGANPPTYPGEVDEFIRSTYDCARSTQLVCEHRSCRDYTYNDLMVEDSHFYSAANSEFPDLDLNVVFGGADTSDAWQHVLVWLRGSGALEGLRARSLRVVQGYCQSTGGQWYPNGETGAPRSCDDWDPQYFDGVTAGTAVQSTFDERLVGVEHQSPEYLGGMQVLYDITRETCELR
jgi:hypothetical protein